VGHGGVIVVGGDQEKEGWLVGGDKGRRDGRLTSSTSGVGGTQRRWFAGKRAPCEHANVCTCIDSARGRAVGWSGVGVEREWSFPSCVWWDREDRVFSLLFLRWCWGGVWTTRAWQQHALSPSRSVWFARDLGGVTGGFLWVVSLSFLSLSGLLAVYPSSSERCWSGVFVFGGVSFLGQHPPSFKCSQAQQSHHLVPSIPLHSTPTPTPLPRSLPLHSLPLHSHSHSSSHGPP